MSNFFHKCSACDGSGVVVGGTLSKAEAAEEELQGMVERELSKSADRFAPGAKMDAYRRAMLSPEFRRKYANLVALHRAGS